MCLEKLGQYPEAAEKFTKSLELDPKRVEAKLGLGICLLHQEKPEAAIENFDACLDANPNNTTAMFGKAVGLQFMWMFDEATAIYKRILEANPNAQDALVNLITIGIARKEIPMVREYCERLICAAAVLARRARRPGHLRVRRRRLRGGGALLRETGRGDPGPVRALVQLRRGLPEALPLRRCGARLRRSHSASSGGQAGLREPRHGQAAAGRPRRRAGQL